jgi:hypothetical protein
MDIKLKLPKIGDSLIITIPSCGRSETKDRQDKTR